MSNYLAVATVTGVLAGRLRAALKDHVGETEVHARRPANAGEEFVTPTILLHLYRVTPNAAWRNSDQPALAADGSRRLRTPRAALDLHYLLCFYGDAGGLVPERLLGAAVAELQARPVLTRELIRQTVEGHDILGRSDLADSVELVKLTPTTLGLEDLARLWGLFPQAAQALALAYEAAVVLIEPEPVARVVEPVIVPNVVVAPFKQPVVERVDVEGDTLLIKGHGLRGPQTLVQIGRLPALPGEQPQARASGPRRGEDLNPILVTTGLSDSLIQLPLPPTVPAGIHGLRVVHRRQIGASLRTVAESSALPLLVRPRIGPAGDGLRDGGSPAITVRRGRRAALEVVEIAPPIVKGQRVRLLLNQVAPPPAVGAEAAYHALEPTGPVEAPALSFALAGVGRGEYVARIEVDGIQSPLRVEAGPGAGERRLVGPRVKV